MDSKSYEKAQTLRLAKYRRVVYSRPFVYSGLRYSALGPVLLSLALSQTKCPLTKPSTTLNGR